MLFSHRSSVPKAYRFLTRVIGRALPEIDKALRLRCTLNAADHTVLGVSAVVIHLGTASACDHELELVHEPAAHDGAPPAYFELVASLAPVAAPTTRIAGAFLNNASSDGTEYRIAGIMDPGQSRIVLPEITLRGV